MTVDVIVVGAGIAGASTAWHLAERGASVLVLESAAQPGSGASGNPVAILYPKLVPAQHLDGHLQSQAFLRALKTLQDPRLSPHFLRCGVLWLAGRKPVVDMDSSHPWWQTQVWPVTAAEASAHAGLTLSTGGWWLPNGGLLHPAGLLAALLAHPRIQVRTGCRVLGLRPVAGNTDAGMAPGWQVHTSTGELEAASVVIANAGDALALPQTATLPLRPVRGQITTFSGASAQRAVLCYGGYLSPSWRGLQCLGATFQPGRVDDALDDSDDRANLQTLAALLPDVARALADSPRGPSRTSVRWQTTDYLPLMGELPDLTRYRDWLLQRKPKKGLRAPADPDSPRLFVSVGHGAKGFTQAWFGAELIAAQWAGAEPELQADLIAQVRPERFLEKAWRRGELTVPVQG